MPIIKLKDIHKSFGPEVVLDGLDLAFYPRQKVGMVGANGCGKTTILKIILEATSPDMGKLTKRKNLKIGYLPQEPSFDPNLTVVEQMHTQLEEVFAIQNRLQKQGERLESLHEPELTEAMKQYERLKRQFELAGGYKYETKIQTLLAGVGLDRMLYQQKTSSLSGGQLSRLGLAKVLLDQTDVLLLDEPTNHLDLQAIEWLEKFLRNYSGAVIMISHDRYLLDRIAEKIVEIEDGKAKTWKGNYTNYVATKETVELHQGRQLDKKLSMIEKTKDFIARNKDQEGMRGTARGRAKRLKKMLATDDELLSKQTQRRKMNFAFAKSKARSSIVFRCEELEMSFGSLTLIKNLTLDILCGQRLGITGPNGTGKSTLLKLALGQLKPTSGSITMGKTLAVGYLDQHANQLDPANTVISEARSVRPDLTEEALRSRLGAFGFTGEDVFKGVADISRGQQNRLMISKLVLTEPDVLVLDEPTNHLDIASKEALEKALKQFNGAVIVVSHDRYFLNQIAEKLLVIGVDNYGAKKIGEFEFIPGPGAYSKYAKLIEERSRQRSLSAVASATKRKKLKVKTALKTPKQLRRFNKLSIDQIEESIIEIEAQVSQMQERFGDQEIYQNVELLAELKKRFEEKKQELTLLYQAYESRGK